MNTYKTKFFAKCPANGIRVEFHLSINTGSVIPVEDIVAEVESIKAGFHEEIADRLHSRFGGSQTMVADHHGVQIETIRPHLAHWHSEPAAHQPAKEPHSGQKD